MLEVKKIFAVFVLSMGLVSCSMATPESVIVKETVVANVPVTVEVTREVEVTRLVEIPVMQEVTRIIENVVTATPAPTATETPVQEITDIVARNYLNSQESGDVTIQIGRALIAQKDAIPQEFEDDLFQDKDVLAMLIFVITNNSDSTVSVFPTRGTVQVNTEQIELFDYLLARSNFGDELDGEIFPGVTKIGGLWFAIGRSELDEVTQMIFRANAPRVAGSGSIGPNYEIVIDLSERVFEQLPDEFR
jgi:hypothetical protein